MSASDGRVVRAPVAFVTCCSCNGGGKRPNTVQTVKRTIAAAAISLAAAATATSLPLNVEQMSLNNFFKVPQSAEAAKKPKAREWTYDGIFNGPDLWGVLGYPACFGKEQSPINVQTTSPIIQKKGAITQLIDYQDREGPFIPATVHKNPHFICSDPSEGSCGQLKVGGEIYNLIQFHFHAPAENLIDGWQGDAELHLVHKNPKTKKLLVVGIIYKGVKGKGQLPGVEASNVLVTFNNEVKDIPTSEFLEGKPIGYYSWKGSLTTPPCKEGVDWVLLDKVYDMPMEGVEALRSTTKVDNNRPVQKNINPIYHISGAG